jgi:hypothetical protein
MRGAGASSIRPFQVSCWRAARSGPARGLNKRPRAEAATTISRPQYDVPLLPPRIAVERADLAVVRRQEEAAKARVGAR